MHLAGFVWLIPVPEEPNDMCMIAENFRLSQWCYSQFNLQFFDEENGENLARLNGLVPRRAASVDWKEVVKR